MQGFYEKAFTNFWQLTVVNNKYQHFEMPFSTQLGTSYYYYLFIYFKCRTNLSFFIVLCNK